MPVQDNHKQTQRNLPNDHTGWRCRARICRFARSFRRGHRVQVRRCVYLLSVVRSCWNNFASWWLLNYLRFAVTNNLCFFSVRPPKKSWKNICNLSGGEKTLSSLALVFALHHYRPTPLYVMDEIDAALDFKNVTIIARYIIVSNRAHPRLSMTC